MKYKLVCMSFDGEFVMESFEFNSIKDVWVYSEDMGSRWFFYPFHFVVTESLKTIVSSPYGLECFNRKKLKNVAKIFKAMSEHKDTKGMNSEEFTDKLRLLYL